MKRLVCNLLSISLSLLILFGSVQLCEESQTQNSTPNQQYPDSNPDRVKPSPEDYGILI